jgi:intracellular septation protein
MFIFTPRFLIGFFIEFGPIALFFLGSELHPGVRGFFLGTKLLVAATVVSLIAAYVRDRRFAVFPFTIGVFTLFMGGATIWFSNPIFVQLEYTLYNGIFGAFILITLAMKRLPLRHMFGSMLAITDRGWEILSLRFGIMLLLLALLNEIILHLHALQLWVYFRFSSYIFSTAFGLCQAFLVRKYRLPEASPWGMRI